MFYEFWGYLFFSEVILTKASKQDDRVEYVLAVMFTEVMRFLFM